MAAPIVGGNSGGIRFACRSFQSASKMTLPSKAVRRENGLAVFDLIRGHGTPSKGHPGRVRPDQARWRGLSPPPDFAWGQETRPFVVRRRGRRRRHTARVTNFVVVFRIPRVIVPHPTVTRWAGKRPGVLASFLRLNVMTRCWNREVRRTGHRHAAQRSGHKAIQYQCKSPHGLTPK